MHAEASLRPPMETSDSRRGAVPQRVTDDSPRLRASA
jgi:hypothetical protein